MLGKVEGNIILKDQRMTYCKNGFYEAKYEEKREGNKMKDNAEI